MDKLEKNKNKKLQIKQDSELSITVSIKTIPKIVKLVTVFMFSILGAPLAILWFSLGAFTYGCIASALFFVSLGYLFSRSKYFDRHPEERIKELSS